jgi:5-methylcytosine-specific restriction endonuclease McrA
MKAMCAECDQPVDSKGLCTKHYKMAWARKRYHERLEESRAKGREKMRRRAEKHREYARSYATRRSADDPEFNSRRAARQRERRRLGLIRHRPGTKERKRDRQRAFRQANPEWARAQKLLRRAGYSPVSEDVVALLMRDPCAYCGGLGGTIDHITPIIDGGTNDDDNLTAACRSCNGRKSDRDLLTFLVVSANDRVCLFRELPTAKKAAA